jgi:hypothetical protein
MSAPLTISTVGTVVPNAGGQAGFANDYDHRFIALEGGWNSGKSFIGARKLLTLHTVNAFDQAGQPTLVPSAVVAPTMSNLSDYDIPHLEDTCEAAGISYEIKSSRGALNLICKDFGTRKRPSLVFLRSADKPERITGWVVGAAWGDEVARWKQDYANPTRDAYLQLIGRVRHAKARRVQCLFTYTNEGDGTRVYQEFRRGLPTHALYRAGTAENPHAKAFLEQISQVLTPELARQYIAGDALSLRGARIYGAFEPARHQDAGLELVRGLPFHLSLDFNIAPGMHCILGQYEPSRDRFTAVFEIHEPRLDLVNCLRKAVVVLRACGFGPGQELEIFADASGGAKSAGRNESCFDIIRELMAEAGLAHRLRVPAANPPIQDRFNAFNLALNDIRGEAHYAVHPRCTRLLADLGQYKRDERGQPDTQGNRLSHASDAEGYRIHYLRPIRKPTSELGGRFSV